MPHRTFGLDELARYLHLSRADIEQLVKNQDIPFEKHGNRVVFRRAEIDAWASQRILGLEGRRLTEYHGRSSLGTREVTPGESLITDMMEPGYIAPALAAKTKASVLRTMAELADKTGHVCDRAALLTALEEREALCSTGIPGGLALLHPRHHDPYLFESPFIVLGRTVQQIPFGAPDGRSTDLFFLLGCPDDRLHLHTLARLCVMALKTDLLEELRAAGDAEAMFDRIRAAEDSAVAGLPGRARG
jgi:PTS system nitrogen regulatory IIA component